MKKARLIRKSPFTLLEVLISFALLGCILWLLFSQFRSSSILSVKAEKMKKEALLREHTYERLSTLFAKVEASEQYFFDEGQSSFYTDEVSENDTPSSLFFATKHPIDPDPSFSGYVVGSLFLDDDHHLTLELHPLKQESSEKIRIEKLIPNVKELRFTFYKYQKESDDYENKASTLKQIDVSDRLDRTSKELPFAMTLTLERYTDTAPLEYTFFLTSEVQPIEYKG